MAGLQIIPNCSTSAGEPIEVDLCSEPAFVTDHCTPDCQQISFVWHKPDCDTDAVLAGHILPDGTFVGGPYGGPLGDCTACSGGGLESEQFCAFDVDGNKIAVVKVVCDFSDPTNPTFTVYDLDGNVFTGYDFLDVCPDFTVQWECLCDDGTVPNTPFLRAYGWDSTASQPTVLGDYDLDGADYALVGGAVKCSDDSVITDSVCFLSPADPFTINSNTVADCDIAGDGPGDPVTYTWTPTVPAGAQICYPNSVVDNGDGSFSITGVWLQDSTPFFPNTTDGTNLPGHVIVDGVCYEFTTILCSGGDDLVDIVDHVVPVELIQVCVPGVPAVYYDCNTGQTVDPVALGWEQCAVGYQETVASASCKDCLDASCDTASLNIIGTREICDLDATCTAQGISGAYTTAPDTPEDFTALLITYELFGGTQITLVDDPGGVYTWRDYLEGGRLEQLVAGLPYPTDLTWSYNPDDGVNTQVDIELYICFPPEVETFSLSWNSGDATVNSGLSQELVAPQRYTEVTTIDCDGNISCIVYDTNKNVIFDPGILDGLVDCPELYTNPISVRPLCVPTEGDPAIALVDATFIESMADNGAGGTWQAAIAPLGSSEAPGPSPTGTVASYTGTAENVTYTVEMVDFAAGVGPSSLVRRNFVIENPGSQGGAGFSVSGFDNTTGSSLNENSFLVCFDQPLDAWGATFLDLESDPAFQAGRLILFDAAENQLADDPIVYPNAEDGNNEVHFIGFTRTNPDVSCVLIVVGASVDDPNPNTNRLAFGKMRFPVAQITSGEYIEVTYADSDGNLTCVVYDENKQIVTDQSILDMLVSCNDGILDKLCEIAVNTETTADILTSILGECDVPAGPDGFLITSGKDGESPLTFPIAPNTANIILDGFGFGPNSFEITDCATFVDFLNTNPFGVTYGCDANGDITISDGTQSTLVVDQGGTTVGSFTWDGVPGEIVPALGTIGCYDRDILDKLCAIADTLSDQRFDSEGVCVCWDETVAGEVITVTATRYDAFDEITGLPTGVSVYLDNAGVDITASVPATGVRLCDKAITDPECVKWSSNVVFLDNTGTRFSESYEIEVVLADGTSLIISDPGGHAGWTAQMQTWETLFAAEFPECVVEVRCNRPGGCGGLLEPPSDAQPPSNIFARYLSIICCPTSNRVPIQATIIDSSNPNRIGRVLVQFNAQTPERRGWICHDCGADGAPVLLDENMEPVPAADLPACWFVCAEDIPSAPESNCSFSLTEGCDNVNSTDPADWVNIVRSASNCDGVYSISYFIEDVDGGLQDYSLVGDFVDCDSGEPVEEPAICLEPTSVFKCYGSDSTIPAVTYINDDNTTDIDASQNLTDIKWNLQPGQEADADAITAAIEDCINSGEIAHITWTDATGVTSTFDADTIVTPASAGQALYSGVGNAGWAGKLASATLICGDSSVASGKAVLWTSCTDGANVFEWRDCLTNTALTQEQLDTLAECTEPECVTICPDCPTDSVQTIVCAEEDATDVTIGDQLLLVGVADCDGNLLSSAAYNLDNQNLPIDPLPLSGACDPQPEVEELRECIVDVASVQWTQLIIINADGSQSDPIYINQENLQLGTPAGDPAEWTSCLVSSDFEVKDRCFYDSSGNKYDGCEIIHFSGTGYTESSYLISGTEYITLPTGLRGPFDCGICINEGGCFDPRIARFNSITFADGTVIDLDAIYGVDLATTNDVVAEVTGLAGGTGAIPTEYSTPPSLLCVGSNSHSFQFVGLSNPVVEIAFNFGIIDFVRFGACDPCDECYDYGTCGFVPTPTDDMVLTPGGIANGGVCDDSLLKALLPKAGTKEVVKVKSVKFVKKSAKLSELKKF